MPERDAALQRREQYGWLLEMPTRWVDNDRYGHMNNAVYYSLFENTLMSWLEVDQGFDLSNGELRCYTVENGCCYHAAVAYPDRLRCGLRVARIGNSSVRYELGVFVDGQNTAAATGFIADVFVQSATERPIRIPDPIRVALESLVQQ